MAKKVILHNSHIDPLTPGRTGTRGEQAYQQQIHAKVADMLEAKGLEVDIYSGKSLPVGVKGDLYLTLHLNGAINESAHGFCVSIYPKSTTPNEDQNLKDLLIENLSKMPIRNFQGYETENSKYMYGLTRISKTTPGALVELGFATNPNENAWLLKNMDEVAGYVAETIKQFLGIEIKAGRVVDKSEINRRKELEKMTQEQLVEKALEYWKERNTYSEKVDIYAGRIKSLKEEVESLKNNK